MDFWCGGYAGTLGYRCAQDAKRDMLRWAQGEFLPERFWDMPAWLDGEGDGQPDDGVYQLNTMDEIEERMRVIEPVMRTEEALERAAALQQAA